MYLYEEDSSKSTSADDVFINEVEHSDVYIGLIGSEYGDSYRNGVSATEYEYNAYSSNKTDSYFFVKNVYERDVSSSNFLARISQNHNYKFFNNPQELVDEVKIALKDYVINKLSPQSFDEIIVKNSSCEDVDSRALELFFENLTDEQLIKLKDMRDMDKILEYIGAGKIDERGNFHLNNAGVLFFAEDISKFHLDHDIKMVRFNGTDRLEIIDRHMSKSSFFILLEEFDEFFKKNTKLGAVVDGMKRVDIPEYPIKAVREGFVNALAHRNYDLKGNCITFYIHDDRIEIGSPGELPYPMTLEKLGIEDNPRHRNENICNIFSKTKYMEHVGTGIKRMRDEMSDAGLKEPEFSNDGFFFVKFYGPNGELIYDLDKSEDLTQYNLNHRQLEALTKMTNEKIIFSFKIYSEYFKVSKSTSKRDLYDLINKKLIQKEIINNETRFFV